MYAVNMFFTRYAEGAYYDAAVWARRIAEVYCEVLLRVFDQDLGRLYGLYDMTWALPDCVWQYSAYQHVSAYGGDHRDIAVRLGMHLSRHSLFEDLDYLRWYGNMGTHASRFLCGARLQPDPGVVVSVIRVACSFSVWHRRCSKL